MNISDMSKNSETMIEVLKEAYNCCECGICEMYACPMGINPCYMNIKVKSILREAGIQPNRNVENKPINKMIQARRVPTDRLISRLELSQYVKNEVDMNAFEIKPSRVTIALNQHIGKPATAIVNVGDSVSRMQRIAEVSIDDIGANLHSSIDGVVRSVDNGKITIEREN